MAINEIVVCQIPDFNRTDIADIMRQIKASGATSVQIYTFWRDFEPDAEGDFKWDYFDRQVKLIKDAGLKWVPFILIGPKYAAPKWWLDDPRHKGLVCLEHCKTSPIDSIWSDGIRYQVAACEGVRGCIICRGKCSSRYSQAYAAITASR